jgi:hypothetical protein
MVEHTVEEQPHTPVPAGRDQGVEVGIITQGWINLKVVDRVVTVSCRGKDRAEQQPVAALGNQVIEPPLQPRQPILLDPPVRTTARRSAAVMGTRAAAYLHTLAAANPTSTANA